jgi:hypothetical protein
VAHRADAGERLVGSRERSEDGSGTGPAREREQRAHRDSLRPRPGRDELIKRRAHDVRVRLGATLCLGLKMLLREDERGWIAIGQPSHAWISGQLARSWGNQRFGSVEPADEVCLAAEQHDVGWTDRDLVPIYNLETGRPRSFMEMPLDIHLGLFTKGPLSLVSQSRYAALLASMHGWRLYARRDLGRSSPGDADAIRAFLAEQREFQQALLDALRADPATAPAATDELIERNSLLIWTWDYLSLAVCLGWARASAKDCPTAEGTVDLELTLGADPTQIKLEPWPFTEPEVTVHCEGRRLPQRFGDEQEMREAFAAAPWETLEFELAPG